MKELKKTTKIATYECAHCERILELTLDDITKYGHFNCLCGTSCQVSKSEFTYPQIKEGCDHDELD